MKKNDLFGRLNRTNLLKFQKRLGEIKEQITLVILDIKDEITKDFGEQNYEFIKGHSQESQRCLKRSKMSYF